MKKLLLIIAAAFFAMNAAAQVNPMQPIPADKDVRVGRLENGMTYYIRHNEKPKGQADFYILHNVGAIQEGDAQQGLAHFLEHMAFNGTKNLPGKQLTEYLEKVGVKFGLNLNAGTGWDDTTYMITDVPVVREGVIDSALLVLHDWSHFISLLPDEIESERGVIMEELRTIDGAGWRSQFEMIKALGKGSKYEERNLIGHLDGLKNFEHQELVDFYHRWYRPDLQAVIVVGDLDVDAVEAKIKTLMADIPAPAPDAPVKEPVMVPDNEEPIVSIFTDPEISVSRIQIFVKRPAQPDQINGLILGELYNTINAYLTTMENARLQEIAMKPDAPFMQAGMGPKNIGVIPTLESAMFIAMTQDGQLAEGFRAIYTEMEKVRRYGFTQGEFERAQNDLMRQAERSYANRNDRRNGEFVNTYLSNYKKNTPMPDAETEWQIDSMLIKMITVDAVNAYAQQVIYPHNQVITITSPKRDGLVIPTEEEILAIRQEVLASQIEAHADNAVVEPLIPAAAKLKGSPVKKTSHDATLGTTEWTLANGVKIVVKPTAFKADEVLMNATSNGGLSLLSNDEFGMGENIRAIASFSGIGKFSTTDLRKALSGKSASVSPNATNYQSSVVANGSPKDLETMLQLVYLTFTSPRFDKNDYDKLINIYNTQFANLKNNPDYLMQQRVTDVQYGHNPRRQTISSEIVDKFDFDALPAVYKKLFPDANSFTFTFVGNVDLNTLKPLVEKYIGSIPVSKKAMTYVNDKSGAVKGEVTDDFTAAMQQPKVSVYFGFTGGMPNTLKDKVILTLLSQALDSRYLVSIREEKGGTYGVRVGGSSENIPEQTYALKIMFDTNEEMADELCEIVLSEIHEIAENGPKSEDVEKTREFLLKNWSNTLEQNNGWMRYIQAKQFEGLNYLPEYVGIVKSITNADVQALAKKILADNNIVKVVMRPEKQ